MFRIARSGCLVFLGLLAGCGGGAPSTSYSGPPPPHKGNRIAISGGQGYVEVVKKEVSGRSPISAEISFYFLRDDGTTPYSPSPGAGTLTVGKKKVDLKAEGDGLVTPNGASPLSEERGGWDAESRSRWQVDQHSLGAPLKRFELLRSERPEPPGIFVVLTSFSRGCRMSGSSQIGGRS